MKLSPAEDRLANYEEAVAEQSVHNNENNTRTGVERAGSQLVYDQILIINVHRLGKTAGKNSHAFLTAVKVSKDPQKRLRK